MINNYALWSSKQWIISYWEQKYINIKVNKRVGGHIFLNLKNIKDPNYGFVATFIQPSLKNGENLSYDHVQMIPHLSFIK
jgi:hypothetical protein